MSLHTGSVWHLFKINLRNYHSGRVPSLGFYNFIFLLQCLYPRAPQFIYAAQPRWIINHGREQKDDERHKRSIIHTQPHTFSGGGGVLLSLFLYPYLCKVLLKSDKPRLELAHKHASALTYKHRFSHTCSDGKYVTHTYTLIPTLSAAHTHTLVYCQFPLPFLYSFKAFELRDGAWGVWVGWGCKSSTSPSEIPTSHSKLAKPLCEYE